MNKIIITGRLTADPELKTLQSGTEVSNFTVAVDRKFKRDGQPTADFFNCIAFSKTAGFVAKWFTKGKMIALEGNIQNRSWDDKDGNKRYATEILVDSVEFCGDKSSPENKNNNSQNSSTPSDYTEIDDDGDLPF